MHPAPIAFALIAALAPRQAPAQQPNPLHIKVVLATRVHMVQRDEQGAVTLRRGFIEPSQITSIESAIKLAKESVEASSGGKVQVSFDVLTDPEAYYVWFDPNRIWINNLGAPIDRGVFGQDGQILGQAFAEDVVGAWLNEDGFTNEVSPNYGPFSAAVIIHAGKTSERSFFEIHKTPVHVLSWQSFSQEEPVHAMAVELANIAAERAGIPHPDIAAPESTAAFGEFTSEPYNDPQAGTAIRIASEGITPRGGVQIASVDGQSGYLNLKVRTKSNAPFALVGLDAEGRALGAALLGAAVARPLEAIDVPTSAYNLPTDDSWHTVSVPISELGGNPSRIVMALHPYAKDVELNFNNAPVIDVASVEFKSLGDSAALSKAEAVTVPTLGLESPALMEALTSPRLATRIDAAWRLAETKAPEAVPQLLLLTQSANPLEVVAAIAAIAYQDTPEGWAAIRTLLFTGPFDVNRRFAATALIGRLTTADVPDMTPALAVRSWRTRKAVIDALISVEGRESSIILGTSLDDPFPQVRSKIVSSISLKETMLLRRLIFTAVNDASQYVRETTYIRLMDVEDEAIRSDALKGVKDDSLGVRLGILAAMKSNPKPHYRSAIRVAVTDSSPAVRAAALEALTVQSEAVDPNEIRNTFSDTDEAVQMALVRMAISGQVILPPDVVQTLKASPHETVREAAKELG